MQRRTVIKTSIAAAIAATLASNLGAQQMDAQSQASFDTVMAFMGAMGSGDMETMSSRFPRIHVESKDKAWRNLITA